MATPDQSLGICPNCGERAAVGDSCPENGCVRRGYRFVPVEYLTGNDEPPALVGRTVGKYLVVKVLGAGGFGTVYLALQLPLLMKVALKQLHRQDDPSTLRTLLRKFESEGRALACINHPNIVRLIDFGVQDEAPYLVMEYVPGSRTLKQEIAERGRRGQVLLLSEVRAILVQTIDGLSAAHEQGVLHRDVKPENLMLQAVQGNPLLVRLVDFGLAKFTADGRQTSRVMGTPAYMAPEQFTQTDLGPWTDLYAVGVMAFELMTGQQPYPGRTPQEMMAKKLDPAYDPLARMQDVEIPGPVEAFLRRALARDPQARFRTGDEFRNGLERALAVLERGPAGNDLSRSINVNGLVNPQDRLDAAEETPSSAEPSMPPPNGAVRRASATAGLEERDPGARRRLATIVAAVGFVAVTITVALILSSRFSGPAVSIEDMAARPVGTTSADETASSVDVVGGTDAPSAVVLDLAPESIDGSAFGPEHGVVSLVKNASATLETWEIASGQRIRSFRLSSEQLDHSAFSQDGRSLLAVKTGSTAIVVDVERGETKHAFEISGGSVRSVAISGDGRLAAFELWVQGPVAPGIRVVSVASGAIVSSLPCSTEAVTAMEFSPDGRTLATAFGWPDRTIGLWDVESGKLSATLGASDRSWSGRVGKYQEAPIALAFSRDGRSLVSATNFVDKDGSTTGDWVVVWDVDARKEHRVLEASGSEAVVVSPVGDVFVSTGEEIISWPPTGNTPSRVLKNRRIDGDYQRGQAPGILRFSEDGQHFLSARGDGLFVWNTGSWDLVQAATSILSEPVGVRMAIASGGRIGIIDDNNYLTSAGLTYIWDLSAWRRFGSLDGSFGAEPSAGDSLLLRGLTPDGARLVTWGGGDRICLWDVPATRRLVTLPSSCPGDLCIEDGWDKRTALASDGSHLLIAGKKKGDPSGYLAVLDFQAKTLRALDGHGREVTFVAAGRTGRKAFSADDATVIVWDAATWRPVRINAEHEPGYRVLALSDDETTLFVRTSDGRFELWNSTSFATIVELERWDLGERDFGGGVLSVDGDLAAAWHEPSGRSGEATFTVWDVKTGRRLRRFQLPWQTYQAPGFSSNGRFLFVPDQFCFRAWNVESDELAATFASFQDGEWVVVTPDGYYDASPGGDKHLSVVQGNRVSPMDAFRERFHRQDLLATMRDQPRAERKSPRVDSLPDPVAVPISR